MNRGIRKEGGHHERVAEPVSCSMVLQISQRIRAEVSTPVDIRVAEAQYLEG